MRNLLQHLPRPTRRFLPALAAAILLVAAGCALLRNDEDGLSEPPRLAEYVVTVMPPSVSVVLTPQATQIPIEVLVSGSCAGEFIPPECAVHEPFWAYSGKRFLGTLTFSDERSPSALATLTLDGAKYYSTFDLGALMGNSERIPITFYPKKEIRDVGLRRGRLDLHLKYLMSVEEQQEVPANEARITVSPHRLKGEIARNNSAPAVMEATISYKGPATTLNITGPTDWYGSTPGSASKFLVLPPPASSLIAANEEIKLIVQFQVPLDDFNFYKAAIRIAAEFGESVEVVMKGSRTPF